MFLKGLRIQKRPRNWKEIQSFIKKIETRKKFPNEFNQQTNNNQQNVNDIQPIQCDD